MDNEKIDLDLARLEAPDTPFKKKTPPLVYVQRLLAAAFASVSVLIHLAMIASAVEYLKTDGKDLLFSVVVPKYEISEPMIPILPEGSTIEKDEEDEQDDRDIKFIEKDLSTGAELGLSLMNETSYTPDLYQLFGSDRPSPTLKEIQEKYGPDAPAVLIYHTHATEGYSDTKGTSFRTEDNEKNTVAIGKAVAEVLDRVGIKVIHLDEQFDRDDWNLSYTNSSSAVKKTLKKYPSIQYVLDIHRDCIGNDADGYVKGITRAYGKDTAQLMFVCGTDEGGSGHTQWRKNLTFALKLQNSCISRNPGLMRPVNLRRASFYQDTRPSALILECGTCANTLTEAKRASVLFACTLADYILGDEKGPDELEMLGALCP